MGRGHRRLRLFARRFDDGGRTQKASRAGGSNAKADGMGTCREAIKEPDDEVD